MEPGVSLKVSKKADETLWGRAISNFGRLFYSSNFSVYNFLAARRRNAVLRAFNNYLRLSDYKDEQKRTAISEKYNKTYSNYISILNNYITEHIYAKMQNDSATVDEQHIMAKYYAVNKFKGVDEVEHRTRLETLVLNMEWENVQSAKSEGYVQKFKSFYLYKIEELYKAQMRHNAILLANSKPGDRTQYEAIYEIIETYIKEVLPILPEKDEFNSIIKDYKKYVSAIDSYDKKDFLELRKRLALLGFSKPLFEFSFPVVAQEQCYQEIIEIARILITNYYTDAEKFACYEVLLDAIEEYLDNVLDYKVYWVNQAEKADFIAVRDKMVTLKKLARIDYDCYLRKREALFIKYDLKAMKRAGIKLPEVKDYYRERLIICHELRILKNHPILTNACYYKSGKKVSVPTILDARVSLYNMLEEARADLSPSKEARTALAELIKESEQGVVVPVDVPITLDARVSLFEMQEEVAEDLSPTRDAREALGEILEESELACLKVKNPSLTLDARVALFEMQEEVAEVLSPSKEARIALNEMMVESKLACQPQITLDARVALLEMQEEVAEFLSPSKEARIALSALIVESEQGIEIPVVFPITLDARVSLFEMAEEARMQTGIARDARVALHEIIDECNEVMRSSCASAILHLEEMVAESIKATSIGSVEKIINGVQTMVDSQYSEYTSKIESEKEDKVTLLDLIIKSAKNLKNRKAKI